MNTVVKVLMIISIFSLLVVSGCWGGTNTEEVIKIGSIMPLTGDASSYGIPGQETIEFAVEEINNAGGIDGKTLEVIYEDGTCDAKGATNAAQKLIHVDGVKVILGGFCSGETLGAAPLAEENKVILFSPGSGSPDITNAGDYIFRNFPSDATSASKVAKAAIEKGHTKMGIISEQTDFAQALRRVFKETYESEGGEVVSDETFVSDSSDFRAQITKIKTANPDGVYVASQTPIKAGLVLKQLSELEIDQQLYTNELVSTKDILDNYPGEAEGAIFAEPAFDETFAKSAELIKKLEERYGEIGGSLPPVYYATTYDAVYILKESIEECGEDTDCIKDYLYNIRDRAGAAGMLSIDSNGDAEFEYVLKSIENGQIKEGI